MLRVKTPRKRDSQRGSVILESLIAILILSFGIIALMGLQGTIVKQAADAKYRSDASFLTNQILGEMWLDRENLAQYVSNGYGARADWDTQLANVLPNGEGEITVAGGTVTVKVLWLAPGEAANTPKHQYQVSATITDSAP